MTKQDFLEELKNALSGEVPAEVLMDSYRYYANYIEEELRNGRREEEILEELGKPSLIARSIIAAQAGERVADVEYMEDGTTRKVRRKDTAGKQEKTTRVHREFVFDFNSWYARVLYIAVIILILIIVLSLLKFGLWILVTFGIPILIILGIIYLVMYFLR